MKPFHEQLNDLTFALADVAQILDPELPFHLVEPNGADIPDHLEGYINDLNTIIDDLQERIREARKQFE